MDENQFWLNIWRAAMAAVLGLALTFAGCSSYQNRLIASSADPLATARAISNSGQRDACYALTANKK